MIIVEDENGEITKEYMPDVDAQQLYHSMRSACYGLIAVAAAASLMQRHKFFIVMRTTGEEETDTGFFRRFMQEGNAFRIFAQLLYIWSHLRVFGQFAFS